jgi:hypothetical protein
MCWGELLLAASLFGVGCGSQLVVNAACLTALLSMSRKLFSKNIDSRVGLGAAGMNTSHGCRLPMQQWCPQTGEPVNSMQYSSSK